MRHFPRVVGLLVAVAVAAPLSAQNSDRVVRTFSEDFPRSGHEAVVLDLNVGEIEVTGATTDTITAEIRVRCAAGRDRKRCEKRAEDVALRSSERRGKLFLEIEGTGMWRSRDATVHVLLTVPRDMTTELEIGTGQLSVENISGDIILEMSIGEATLENVSGNLTIDMGIGEITVSMPQEAIGEVTLDNGVGETELLHRDGRNAMEGILGGTDVHWDSGAGTHTVKVELNVGEISVRLQ